MSAKLEMSVQELKCSICGLHTITYMAGNICDNCLRLKARRHRAKKIKELYQHGAPVEMGARRTVKLIPNRLVAWIENE